MKSQFTLQLDQVKEKVTELQTQQLELANVITPLSRVTAKPENRQQRIENFMFSFNRQLLEQQIITTRRSIENRKLILSQNAQETQCSIKEYNSRKLILQALKRQKKYTFSEKRYNLSKSTYERNHTQDGNLPTNTTTTSKLH